MNLHSLFNGFEVAEDRWEDRRSWRENLERLRRRLHLGMKEAVENQSGF